MMAENDGGSPMLHGQRESDGVVENSRIVFKPRMVEELGSLAGGRWKSYLTDAQRVRDADLIKANVQHRRDGVTGARPFLGEQETVSCTHEPVDGCPFVEASQLLGRPGIPTCIPRLHDGEPGHGLITAPMA